MRIGDRLRLAVGGCQIIAMARTTASFVFSETAGEVSTRVSNEHILIVRVPRARGRPGHHDPASGIERIHHRLGLACRSGMVGRTRGKGTGRSAQHQGTSSAQRTLSVGPQ